MSSLLPPVDVAPARSTTPASIASDASFHSFQDVDWYEAAPPPKQPPVRVFPLWTPPNFETRPVRRQDSGYESIPSGPSPRTSHDSGHRASTSSSSSSSHSRPRTSRPSMQACRPPPKAYQAHLGRFSLDQFRSPQPTGYLHVPNPEVTSDDEGVEVEDIEPVYLLPPQTTHYWTSDHTRRLEYAAIDAATRGVKGWMMKHLVPDCMVPKDKRRLAFDDDSGSVRRYRLDLHDCDSMSKSKSTKNNRKKGWLFGP